MSGMKVDTIKGHGFTVGQSIEWHGMANEPSGPTEDPCTVILGKSGNKYTLTYGEGPDAMVWEFGASARLWANGVTPEEPSEPVTAWDPRTAEVSDTTRAILDLADRARFLGYDCQAAQDVADVFDTKAWDDPCPQHPAISTTRDRRGYAADECESCKVLRLSDEQGYNEFSIHWPEVDTVWHMWNANGESVVATVVYTGPDVVRVLTESGFQMTMTELAWSRSLLVNGGSTVPATPFTPMVGMSFRDTTDGTEHEVIAIRGDLRGVAVFFHSGEVLGTAHLHRLIDSGVYVGVYEHKTSVEWKALEAASNGEREASYERSGADGFRTQAAAQAMAAQYALSARMADRAGVSEFPAAFDQFGVLVGIRDREGRFGDYYVNQGPGGNTAPRTITPSRARSGKVRHANDSARGFRMGTVACRVEVKMSGSWHPYVAISPNVTHVKCTVIDNGTGMTRYQDK